MRGLDDLYVWLSQSAHRKAAAATAFLTAWVLVIRVVADDDVRSGWSTVVLLLVVIPIVIYPMSYFGARRKER